MRFVALLSLAFLCTPSISSAAGSSPAPPPPPRETSSANTNAGQTDSTMIPGRADAEKSYKKGWEISEDAKKQLVAGKADDAKKKFGKALKKFREATDYDPKSFEAYHKCLEIEPEYAQAHEYLGEAYLMTNDLAKAKEQLLWLVSRKSDQA